MELTVRPDEAERPSGVGACCANAGSPTGGAEEAEDTQRTDRHSDDGPREETAAQPSQERRPTFFNKLPFEANEVVPGLWLGDYSSACKKDELKQRGITHVLCVCKNAKFWFPEDFVYHRVTIMDAPSENVVSHFPECIEFMESALLNGGAVFVHCMAGVSRSASVVVAYLMHSRRIKLDCALKHVRAVRPFVNPNPVRLSSFLLSLFFRFYFNSFLLLVLVRLVLFCSSFFNTYSVIYERAFNTNL
ncbi:tyrosine protein phosphatase yvh1, variant 2 [Balamuthia mandrillaris]